MILDRSFKTLVCIAILFAPTLLWSQLEITYFKNDYDAHATRIIDEVIEQEDGLIFISHDFGNELNEASIRKIDFQGNYLWQAYITDESSDFSTALSRLDIMDGEDGFIYALARLFNQSYIIKIDADSGEEIWRRSDYLPSNAFNGISGQEPLQNHSADFLIIATFSELFLVNKNTGSVTESVDVVGQSRPTKVDSEGNVYVLRSESLIKYSSDLQTILWDEAVDVGSYNLELLDITPQEEIIIASDRRIWKLDKDSGEVDWISEFFSGGGLPSEAGSIAYHGTNMFLNLKNGFRILKVDLNTGAFMFNVSHPFSSGLFPSDYDERKSLHHFVDDNSIHLTGYVKKATFSFSGTLWVGMTLDATSGELLNEYVFCYGGEDFNRVNQGQFITKRNGNLEVLGFAQTDVNEFFRGKPVIVRMDPQSNEVLSSSEYWNKIAFPAAISDYFIEQGELYISFILGDAYIVQKRSSDGEIVWSRELSSSYTGGGIGRSPKICYDDGEVHIGGYKWETYSSPQYYWDSIDGAWYVSLNASTGEINDQNSTSIDQVCIDNCESEEYALTPALNDVAALLLERRIDDPWLYEDGSLISRRLRSNSSSNWNIVTGGPIRSFLRREKNRRALSGENSRFYVTQSNIYRLSRNGTGNTHSSVLGSFYYEPASIISSDTLIIVGDPQFVPSNNLEMGAYRITDNPEEQLETELLWQISIDAIEGYECMSNNATEVSVFASPGDSIQCHNYLKASGEAIATYTISHFDLVDPVVLAAEWLNNSELIVAGKCQREDGQRDGFYMIYNSETESVVTFLRMVNSPPIVIEGHNDESFIHSIVLLEDKYLLLGTWNTADKPYTAVVISGEFEGIPIEYEEIPGDNDGNGIVNSGDLILLLSEFGCTENCQFDYNSNGIVGTDDLIFLISMFGVQ